MKTGCIVWRQEVLRWSAFGAVASTALSALAQPHFTAIEASSGQEMLLKLSAPAGQIYRIDTSEDLVEWVPLVSFTATTGIVQHIDSAAPFHSHRFYEAVQRTGSSLVTGDHLATAQGEVVIRTLSHAGVVLSWNDLTIYVDVTNRNTGLPPGNLFVLTHGHADHLNSTAISNAKAADAVIVASTWAYTSLSAALQAITTVLTNGASTNLLGVGIEAVPMYNLSGSPHAKGSGNGYVLTFGGKRLYFTGDTDNTPEMRALRDSDVAFMAMRGPPANMDIAGAVDAVREFRPRVVYPYHYVNNDPRLFKQQLGTDLGIEVRLRPWY